MQRIGVTGNSGSGKTEFSKVLAKKLEAVIINADEIAKKVSKNGTEYYGQIVKLFGKDIIENEEINRKELAKIIYSDETQRENLNKLTNNYVVKAIKEEISKTKNKNIILDVPLLFESKLNLECNINIALLAKKDIKIKRTCKRDNINEVVAKQRLNIQKKDEFYIRNSNYVIVNNEANLEEEAEEFIKSINILNNNIVIIKDENAKYMQFKELLEYKNITHAFTLKPMDFGDNVSYKTRKELVKNNYKNLCRSLQIDYKNIVRPYQTHTNNVKRVDSEKGIFIPGLKDIDALITGQKDEILSLTFADCTPIYFFDKEKNVISLVHSGWQGTTKRIVQNAIRELKREYNCEAKNLICVIGPTIRNCHFEVDEDVRDIFYNEFKEMKDIKEIIKDDENTKKSYIDTVRINKNLMINEGVLEENIIDCNICTLCNSELIHSYRKEGKQAGRNTAILAIRS